MVTYLDGRNLGAMLSLVTRLAVTGLIGSRYLPRHVRTVMVELSRHGFRAYAVGGSVRDYLLRRRPGDWDIASSAAPLYVMSIFPRTVPIGFRHGTVRVVDPSGATVDVTTFRVEGPYTDRRRPDHVRFTGSLTDDLRRRDFTINAMAMSLGGRLIDPFGGLRDLARGLIRCVGDPDERLREDALRMMRAVRLKAQLGFSLDRPTAEAIRRRADLLADISIERVRDEFSRCLLSDRPGKALEDFRALGLLPRIVPELLPTVGTAVDPEDGRTVWEHTLAVVAATPPVLHLRLAALFHDIAKPAVIHDEPGRRGWPGQDRLGADMASSILTRLRYDRATVDRVSHLVRHHLSLGPPDMKEAAIRRLINRVGRESIPELIQLRQADRKAAPGRERGAGLGTSALLVRLARLAREEKALSLSDLAVCGDDVVRVAKIAPGPQVGVILRRLLEEVLEDPTLNHKRHLEERIQEMARPGLPRPPISDRGP